jgi:EmrB/QacA subfamily drug resistance transporter
MNDAVLLPRSASPIALSRAVKGGIVAGIFLAILMGALDQFVVLTALPNIATSLGESTGVAFVVAAYLISATVGIPIFGRLADLYSRRDVFLVGLATFIGGSVLAGLSQNLAELIVFRAVQGVASNAFIVVGFAIVAALFPPEARARIAGVFTGTFVIATILGPFLGSFLVDHASWRWVFYINIPIAFVATTLLLASLGPLRPERAGRFDPVGAALLVGWISTLTFALVQNSDSGWAWTDARIELLVASGLLTLLAFVVWELRAKDPLMPISYLARRVVGASGAVSFLRGAALVSLYTFLAIYIGLVLLHGASDAADRVRDVLYFLVIPAVIGAAFGSQLVTRIAYRTLTAVGMGLALVGSLLLTLATSTTPLWQFTFGFLPTGGLILPLLPIGLGIGLTFPVTLLSVQFAVPAEQVGAATSIVQFLSTLGGAVGVALLTSFQEWRLAALAPSAPSAACAAGQVATCANYYQALQSAEFTSVHQVFVVLSALLAVAFVSALFLTGTLPHRAGLGAPESL